MTTILCTLYNSMYLDKGLVLYDSLCECTKDFKLYVLCMDEKCYEVLRDLNQKNHIPIRLSDFEDGDIELLEAKTNRPIGEYCWTCSSSFIRYVLKHYNEDICTYIDADMYFYSDPQILVNEMFAAGKSVMVIPHRFPEEKKELAKKVGTYCVEFNTFMNTPESIEVLEYWRKRCLECCSNLGDGIHWGDQKYLDELVEKFECVHVCTNTGAGVAPWNISQYFTTGHDKVVMFLPTSSKVDLVFYHYQNISYTTSKAVSIGISKRDNVDLSFINRLYKPYIENINKEKRMLASEYGLEVLIQGHPASKHRFSWLTKSKIGQWLLYLDMAFINRIIIVKV